jgi:AcrR family transcriptional regulator
MPEEEAPRKQTRAPGERSRARIVKEAAQLATIEGIEGLSIGRLADATGIAKSSVYALFGSKEELQLATINAARDSFIVEVVTPALGATEPGVTACLPYVTASSPTWSGASSPVAASSSPPPPRSGRAPDVSMTKWPVSNSSGATCSSAKPGCR